MLRIATIYVLLLVTVVAKAATITAKVGTGEWTTGASWVGNVAPVSGVDNVVIPSGATITITDQVINFTGSITIQSGGALNLIANPTWNIARLVMGAGSTITIDAGGQITVSGTSNLVALCGIRIGTNFTAFLPGLGFGTSPQTGPATIDETTTGGPVPIELIFFQAVPEDQQVHLLWATASENNFDYFSIERSADGYNFKEICQIQGNVNSVERIDYHYTDELPLNGRSYYRLRSIDFDGYTEVFDYVMVEVAGVVPDLSVFPNPIENGHFSIQTNFGNEQSSELIIYNYMGRVVATYQMNDWQQQFECNELQAGSYLFKLIGPDDGVIVKRVLVK